MERGRSVLNFTLTSPKRTQICNQEHSRSSILGMACLRRSNTDCMNVYAGLQAGFDKKDNMTIQVKTECNPSVSKEKLKAELKVDSQQNLVLLDYPHSRYRDGLEFEGEGSHEWYTEKGYLPMTAMEISDLKQSLGVPMCYDPLPIRENDIGEELDEGTLFLIQKNYSPMENAEIIMLKNSCGVPLGVEAMDNCMESSLTYGIFGRAFGEGDGLMLFNGEPSEVKRVN